MAKDEIAEWYEKQRNEAEFWQGCLDIAKKYDSELGMGALPSTVITTLEALLERARYIGD